MMSHLPHARARIPAQHPLSCANEKSIFLQFKSFRSEIITVVDGAMRNKMSLAFYPINDRNYFYLQEIYYLIMFNLVYKQGEKSVFLKLRLRT